MNVDEYQIDVAEIEELQMIGDMESLKKIFNRCKSMVVQGGQVILSRKMRSGVVERFDKISTESDLEEYRRSVFKYL